MKRSCAWRMSTAGSRLDEWRDAVCWVRLSDSQGINEDLEEVTVRFVCDRRLTFRWTERDNVETVAT
jgi:hypothetical protein